MTNEKAIQLLHRLSDEQFDGPHGDERREALSMAVRALEGDGDTISRKMAIDAVVSAMIDGADAELVEGVMELLPSAQPERKKGKWILTEDDNYEYCTCSECGYQNGENWMNGSDIPFCAVCGADMRGESDE